MSRGLSSRLNARISRRRALAAAATFAAASALTAAACRRGNDPTDDREGGTMRFGTSLPLAFGLDPHLENASGLAIVPKVYGYLFHVDPDGDTLVLDHAESVEQPDEQTYVVRLRRDLRFHDAAPARGRAVTAQDVVASIERFRTHELVVDRPFHAAVLDGAEAVDDHTVRITLKRPYAYGLHELGHINGGAILPQEAVSGGLDLSVSGAASGPLAIAEATLGDRGLVRLRRHGRYHGARSLVDEMTFTTFPDDDARVDAFLASQLDAISNRNADEATSVSVRASGTVTPEPSLSSLSVGMNTRRAPFGDPRVRRAIDIGIDRQALIRDIAQGAGRIVGAVNPNLASGFWSLPETDIRAAQGGVVGVELRRQEARALVEAAGATGATIALQVADRPQLIDVAAVVRGELRQIGLQADVQVLSLLAWYANFRGANYDATLISHPPYESPDRALRLYHSAGPEGTGSPFAFADTAIDAMIERTWAESDRLARRELVLESQRLMLEARPMAHLFAGTGYTTYHSKVRGMPEKPGTLGLAHYGYWLADDGDD